MIINHIKKPVSVLIFLFIAHSDIILSQTKVKIDTLDFIDSLSCKLSIYSDPKDVQVYLDSVYVGHTPLEINNLIEKEYSIRIFHPPYETWNANIKAIRGKNITIFTLLYIKKGMLSLQCVPENIYVSLDSILLQKDSLSGFMVSYGNHKIDIHSDSLKRSISSTFFINPGDTLSLRARLGYCSLTSTIQSFVIPGVGQMRDGSILEGLAFTTGTLVLFLYSSNLNHQYQDRLTSYNSIREAYLQASTEIDIIRLRNEMSDAYGSANNTFKKRNIAYATLITFYLVNVADAFLFHNKDDEIRVIPNNVPIHASTPNSHYLQDVVFALSIKF